MKHVNAGARVCVLYAPCSVSIYLPCLVVGQTNNLLCTLIAEGFAFHIACKPNAISMCGARPPHCMRRRLNGLYHYIFLRFSLVRRREFSVRSLASQRLTTFAFKWNVLEIHVGKWDRRSTRTICWRRLWHCCCRAKMRSFDVDNNQIKRICHVYQEQASLPMYIPFQSIDAHFGNQKLPMEHTALTIDICSRYRRNWNLFCPISLFCVRAVARQMRRIGDCVI